MASRFICCVFITILINWCRCLEPIKKSSFIIGVPLEININDTALSATIEYLTNVVGALLNPKATFEILVLSSDISKSVNLLRESSVDFVFTSTEDLLCLQAAVDGLVPLATATVSLLGLELHGFGALIFTRADSQLSSLSNLTGTAISLPDLYSAATLLPCVLLADRGLRLLHEPRLLILRGPDALLVANDVLTGAADAGFVRSGALETLAAAGTISMQQFKRLHTAHDRGSGAMDMCAEGEFGKCPFWTSTDVLPARILAAAPSVPPHVQRAVLAALLGSCSNGRILRADGSRVTWLPAQPLLAFRYACHGAV